MMDTFGGIQMKRSLLFLVAVCLLCVGGWFLPAAEPTSGNAEAVGWNQSTRRDDYRRRLGIRTNQFGGVYAADQPIAVSIEIRNFGPADPQGAHPRAQLFPHLDAWIEVGGKTSYHMIPLEFENRLWIEQGEKFVRLLDLRSVIPLDEPGEYRISLGHENAFITDLGDWTGSLRSEEHVVRIVPAAADAP